MTQTPSSISVRAHLSQIALKEGRLKLIFRFT